MSIEEKAKAYEEALNRAKAGKPMDEVFPELKESEDERIRKNLIELLLDTPVQDIISHHLELSKVLAYLEKQKEQKYTNSEKPKEWSEDERIRKHCIWMLKGCLAMEDGLFDKEKVKADIAWLEKQKEQKPVEWSEEDEEKVREIRTYFTTCVIPSIDRRVECVNWLKSLRPRYNQNNNK